MILVIMTTIDKTLTYILIIFQITDQYNDFDIMYFGKFKKKNQTTACV